jgi:hypothetical protein
MQGSKKQTKSTYIGQKLATFAASFFNNNYLKRAFTCLRILLSFEQTFCLQD